METNKQETRCYTEFLGTRNKKLLLSELTCKRGGNFIFITLPFIEAQFLPTCSLELIICNL